MPNSWTITVIQQASVAILSVIASLRSDSDVCVDEVLALPQRRGIAAVEPDRVFDVGAKAAVDQFPARDALRDDACEVGTTGFEQRLRGVRLR